VIVDQRLFCLANGLLDRVELLSQIDASPTLLDHGNDASQVSFGTLQPLDDLRVALMNEGLFQFRNPIPVEGISRINPAVNSPTGVRRGQCQVGGSCWVVAACADDDIAEPVW